MTPAQRKREAAWWLERARLAAEDTYFLCWAIDELPVGALRTSRRRTLQMFQPRYDAFVWWNSHGQAEPWQHGDPQGRTLAALLLAAMAEAGDLDEYYDADSEGVG